MSSKSKSKMNTKSRLDNIAAQVKKLGQKSMQREMIEAAKAKKAAKIKKMKARKPKQITIKGLKGLQRLRGI